MVTRLTEAEDGQEGDVDDQLPDGGPHEDLPIVSSVQLPGRPHPYRKVDWITLRVPGRQEFSSTNGSWNFKWSSKPKLTLGQS